MSLKLRRLLAVLLATLFWFGLAELLGSLWLARYGNALDWTRPILEPDAQLGWRQRANLRTTFLQLPLQTNEVGFRSAPLPKGPVKALVLGPSSTFGWGVREEETYSALLHGVNAGEIGYSSEQGVRLQQQLKDLQPQWVIVAYGVNDVDRFRFYFQSQLPDSQEFQRPHESLPWPSSSALLALSRLRHPTPSVPRLRVSPVEFAHNLRRMVAAARQQGSRVILVSTVYSIPEPPLGEEDPAGKASYEAGRWEEAERLFTASVASRPAQNEAYYYLALLAQRRGDRKSAQTLFAQALAREPARVARDVQTYNQVLRGVAQEERVLFGDAGEWLTGPGNFVDAIHPSPAGHRRIAEGLARLLENPAP